MLYVIPALVVLALIILAMGVKSVPQGYEWTVHRPGRFTHTHSPRLNLIVPPIGRVGRTANRLDTLLGVPSQDVITRDNAIA